MYKLQGATLVIIMCSYYGFYMSSNLKKRLTAIEAFIYSLDYMKSQISYGMESLPDIFRELSKNEKSQIVSNMFKNVYESLCIKNNSDKEYTSDYYTFANEDKTEFEQIWNGEVDMLKKSNVVKSEEVEIIKELGHINTFIDSSMQIKYIDMVNAKLKNIYTDLLKEIKPKMKIYRVAGIMAGIFITIIFI